MLKKVKVAVYAAIPTAVAAAITSALAGAHWEVILAAAIAPFVPVAGAYFKPEPIDSALDYLRTKGVSVTVPEQDA